MIPLRSLRFYDLVPGRSRKVAIHPVFDGQTFARVVDYPVIVAGWSRAVGREAGGRERRAWENNFSKKEQKYLRDVHNTLAVWYLSTGTPEQVMCDLRSLQLLRKAVEFFATL